MSPLLLQRNIIWLVSKSKSRSVAQRLHAELMLLANETGRDFTGVGVLVWDGSTPIPVLQMRKAQPGQSARAAPHERLHELAREGGPFHDGFHVLNERLELVTASVYFSPPVRTSTSLPEDFAFGGRYLAAAFGSCVAGIICTGVLSQHYGPIVFEQGRQL